ncbi:MAG: acyltransferase domain-containing protein [Candidatus Nanopelagicales bacterium]|nr:acyltransferase domain-containing protein [Candidatus Nanopelagicales bacterium]MCF8536974.1 acyltransferase domain-containing protein [Candidatus Nanopelagicales bacterium]MCF8541878.1 acyltransferase domain-containing protein [Candidatus Nanopelagicales bacterium]MCF8556659.1 acyltransferase domain-containing protein [Candidatus Nanopelagicales bacterium]
MLVVVAPGQGSQSPGFLTPWLDVPGVRDRLEWLSAVAGIDLVAHGTESDADTIRDTAVAQPLIVGAGLVTLLSLFPHPAHAFSRIGAGAGHSVGEITAAVGSGVLSAEQAMVFVRERGKGMAAAAAITPTGMTAVLGGDPETVVAKATEHGLTPANMNGAGQIVVAGTLAQLEAFAADPPEGSRVRPLEVAGAFHTEHMAPAVATLSGYGRAITTHDPRIPLISNADGQIVHDGRDVLQRLVTQVSNPVRWDLCMDTMRDIGVTAVIEIPPAGTLTGLIKRALPGVETLALKTPDDLPAAWRMINEHGTESGLDNNPTWRMVVAPIKGTFRMAAATKAGDDLPVGAAIGTVETLRDTIPVVAPHGGTIVEWLLEDGDPVGPGQPIIRLHPLSQDSHA